MTQRSDIDPDRYFKISISEPEFVYSFEYGDHVYFVLREIAVEVMSIEVSFLLCFTCFYFVSVDL